MVYWCAKIRCSLEVLAEAHSSLGNNAPLKDVFETIGRFKRKEPANRFWDKTMATETITPATMPAP